MKNLSLDNGRIEPEGAVLRGTRGWPPLGTLSFATGRFLLQTVFFVGELALTLVIVIMHVEVIGLLSAYFVISSPLTLIGHNHTFDGLPTRSCQWTLAGGRTASLGRIAYGE